MAHAGRAHVQRAFQIHRQLAVARLERDAAREGLDRLGIAAYVVDVEGRILSMNRAGSSLLEEGDALSAPSGRIVARRPRATDRLLHLVACAARTAAASGIHSGGAVELPRRERRPLSATVAPMWGEAFGIGISIPAALLFVRDPDRGAIGAPEQLKALFGLTDAEARLAAALADGRSLPEIAETTGANYDTLRTHMKRLMRKTQVNRQVELVALLLKSAAALSR